MLRVSLPLLRLALHVWGALHVLGLDLEDASLAHLTPCLLPEIEMVIMERSKLSELAIAGAAVQEQNTTDEEKSAATGSESTQWSR